MNTNAKFAAVALAAALVGGSAGSALTSWKSQPVAAENAPAPVATAPAEQAAPATPAPADEELAEIAIEPDAAHPLAPAPAPTRQIASRAPAPRAAAPAPAPSRARRVTSNDSPRRVYYDYSEPAPRASAPSTYSYEQRDNRTFWQKHRDKLTVGIGTGAGAIIGGAAGGKKGALIGAAAGAGGSALYTYKIRKRNSN